MKPIVNRTRKQSGHQDQEGRFVYTIGGKDRYYTIIRMDTDADANVERFCRENGFSWFARGSV